MGFWKNDKKSFTTTFSETYSYLNDFAGSAKAVLRD